MLPPQRPVRGLLGGSPDRLTSTFMSRTPTYVDQNLEILNDAIAHKMTQPQTVVIAVMKQIAAQMDQDSNHTGFIGGFQQNSPKHIRFRAAEASLGGKGGVREIFPAIMAETLPVPGCAQRLMDYGPLHTANHLGGSMTARSC